MKCSTLRRRHWKNQRPWRETSSSDRHQSIPYQQDFSGRKLAVVILSTNRWPLLRPVAARIASALDFTQRGQVTRIDIDSL